jgi:hypothetical protein
MKRMIMIAFVLGLAAGACKKDEKKEGPATTEPDKPAAASDAAAAAVTPPTTPPATPPASADEVTIPFIAPKVGDKQTQEEKMSTDVMISAQGEQMKMVASKEEKKSSEVVEVNGDVITKVKVTYAASKDTQSMAGRTQEKKGVAVGKTYVVWKEGDTIKATDDKGGEVPKEELAALAEDWKRDLGQIPGMAKVITGKPWKLGQKVDLTPEQLKDLAMGDEETTATSASITMTANDGKVATFDVDVAMEQKKGDGSLKIPTHVTVQVDIAKGRPLTMTMKGEIEGDISGTKAKGTMEGTQTATYEN